MHSITRSTPNSAHGSFDGSGFPWATFNLKAVRFRDETLLDLFKKGTETKPLIIKGILDRYPGRTFILVGDSGEQDPEVYAALLREYPNQVLQAYIRNVAEDAPPKSLLEEIVSRGDFRPAEDEAIGRQSSGRCYTKESSTTLTSTSSTLIASYR